jgi:hypothetical protein
MYQCSGRKLAVYLARGFSPLKSEGQPGGGSDGPPKKLWDNGLFSLFGRMTAGRGNFLRVIYFAKIIFYM